MENASKALIIAAAILIAILLISMGVYVVGLAQDQINNSGMSDIEITTFNQKFTKYDGVQRGSAVRTMVQEIMAYNNSYEASDETMISINYSNANAADNGAVVSLKAAANESPVYASTFKNTKTYKVECKYKNGRVNNISVTAAVANN